MNLTTITQPADKGCDLQTALKIDEVCERFEHAWVARERPRIEDYLESFPADGRQGLLRELLATEIGLREHFGQPPLCQEECLARFPEFPDTIRQLFTPSPANDTGHAANLLPTHRAQRRLRLPRQFGEYELLEEIASGGMGVVYRARQIALNRIVAIKMIRAGNLASQEEVKRFHAEAEAVAQLRHPNIVPIFEIGQCEGQTFFSMGYIDGVRLRSLVADGPLEPRDAAQLIRTIAGAVAYAHGQGLLHRDLTPNNVLVDQSGQPWVTDFGLARRIDRDSNLTQTGQVIGTPSFMPPEQARGTPDEMGVAADVYSLGATLYFLLTGRPPFQAATAVETIRQVLDSDPVAPRRLNSAIDRDLDTICLKCLEKKPAARYASVTELDDELVRYLDHAPIQARPISSVGKAVRWCRRKPLNASIWGVVIAATLGLLALQFRLLVTQQVAATHRYFSLVGEARAEADDAMVGWTQQVLEKLKHAAERRPASANPTELRTLVARACGSWDLRQVGMLATPDDVGALTFSPDGQHLAVAELLNDNALIVSVYDPATCAEIRRYSVDVAADRELYKQRGIDRTTPAFHALAYSADGRWLAAGTRHGKIYCWDTHAATDQPYDGWEAHDAGIECLAFAPDEAIVYSAPGDPGPIQRRDVPRRESLSAIPGSHSQIALSPNGKLIASGDGKLRVFNVETSQQLEAPIEAGAVAFARSGDWLAAGDESATYGDKFSIIDLPFKSVSRRFGDQSTLGYAIDHHLALAADDRLLMGACGDERVRVWDVLSGSIVIEALAPGRSPPVAALDREGRYLAVAGPSNAVVYEILHPQAYQVVARGPDNIEIIDFAPDGPWLGTISRTESSEAVKSTALQIWGPSSPDALFETRAICARKPEFFEEVEGNLLFHPSGREAIGGSSTASIRWKRVDSQPQPAFTVETGVLGGLVFEEDQLVPQSSKQCEIHPDPMAANGQAMRIGPGGEVRFQTEGIDLSGMQPGFACCAVVRLEGSVDIPEDVCEVRYHWVPLIKAKRAFTRQAFRSDHYHLFNFSYEPFPAVGVEKAWLEIEFHVPDVPGLKALWIDRILLVPLARPGEQGPPRVYPKFAEQGPFAYSPDGTQLWGIFNQTGIRSWIVASGKRRLDIRNPLVGAEHGNDILRAIACNGQTVVVGSRHGEIFFFSAADGSLLNTFYRPNASVSALAVDPTGQVAVAGTEQGSLWAVSVPDGKLLRELPAHGQRVQSVIFSRDGSVLVTGSHDRSVRIWGRSGNDFAELFRFDKLPRPVRAVRLTTDKNLLAVLFEEAQAVRVWNLDDLNRRFASLDVAMPELGEVKH